MKEEKFKIPKWQLILLFISIILCVASFIAIIYKLIRTEFDIFALSDLTLTLSCTLNFTVSASLTISVTKYIFNISYNTNNYYFNGNDSILMESYKNCWSIFYILKSMEDEFNSGNFSYVVKYLAEIDAKLKEIKSGLSIVETEKRFIGNTNLFNFVKDFSQDVENMTHFYTNSKQLNSNNNGLLNSVTCLITKFNSKKPAI